MQSLPSKFLITLIATFGFSGKIKPAPGTWGSLAGLIACAFIASWGGEFAIWLFAICSFFIGIYAADQYGKITGIIDNGEIVIDEVAAIALMVALLPLSIATLIAIFISFRFFDILKPYPIRYFDKNLKNGFGVMFDDILAAIYGLITIIIGEWLYGNFFSL